MATPTTLPSILLILALAFTVASTSDEAILIKKCTEALGPRSGFVTFCARNFLGHRAAFLATCDRRKTVAVVIKEVHIKAKAVEALEKKIKDGQDDLKSCWRIGNKLVSSIANVFNNNNNLLEEHSKESIMALHEQVGPMKQQCNFSVAGRQSGVWLELRMKVLESLTADLVAWAFVEHLYNITH